MKLKKDLRLEAIEQYKTPKTIMCELCCKVLIRNTWTNLYVYTYVDEDPVYEELSDDENRTFNFVKLCMECGELECTDLKNKLSS